MSASDRKHLGSGASPAVRSGTPGPSRPARGGFTLLEVMIAMALLLVGGVSILAVFTLAVEHRIMRDVEAKLDLVRPEAVAMAQEALDTAKPNEPPAAIVQRPSAQPQFAVSARFAPSPVKDDEAWVALISISYRGSPLPNRQGEIKPVWLRRSFVEERTR
jgi:prepilin-type N-terminal cleavage/methylation domain-containing protein